MIKSHLLVCLLLLISMAACRKKSAPDDLWSLQIPANFPKPDFDLANRPITYEGFVLGRTLFYDPQLSRDNTVSCGSCHIQSASFTQHGHDVSHGIDNQLGRRNSLPIQNMLWEPRFFWDGGVHNLELVPLTAITSPIEMDENPAKVLEKLHRDPRYPALFKAAYGTEDITSGRFLFAMAQFMGALVSADSKYDQVQRHENDAVFSDSEQRGYTLFKNKCASCHAEPLFTDFSFRDNGLYKNYTRDKGRYEISLDSSDLGRFRVPSLRNLTFTRPYMHDGSISTIEGVLDHYAGGMENSKNIDPVFRLPGNRFGIPLTAPEKADLAAFVRTLDDEKFVRNPLFSEQ